MSKDLRFTSLAHMAISVLVGLPLLIIPGRFLAATGWQGMLQALGWQNTEPFATRLFGAALLPLAWSSFRGWRAADRGQASVLIEMEAVFGVLGCAGLLRHLVAGVVVDMWFYGSRLGGPRDSRCPLRRLDHAFDQGVGLLGREEEQASQDDTEAETHPGGAPRPSSGTPC